MTEFARQYGPTALIAGGSEGVGAAYARRLAEHGIDLVLVARRAEPLDALAGELGAAFPERTIRTIAMDLTDPAAPARLAAETADLEVGLLICNAGANWMHVDFVDNDLAYAQKLTTLNATLPMALCHHFGGAMKRRGRGGLILVGSFSAFVGGPTMAVYSAAKAFSTTFAEALWFELEAHGVHVLAHVLGAVNTPFIARQFAQAKGMGDEPDDLAREGLEALGKGPVLRARGGDEMFARLSSIGRDEAVTAIYEAGRLYRES